MYLVEPLEKWKEVKGKTVFKFEVPGTQWIFLNLEKGHSAGDHYHKGLHPIKKPERIVILSGKLKLSLKSVKTQETEDIILEPPCVVSIEPYIVHTFTALEDSSFIEPFSEEALSDRFEE